MHNCPCPHAHKPTINVLLPIQVHDPTKCPTTHVNPALYQPLPHHPLPLKHPKSLSLSLSPSSLSFTTPQMGKNLGFLLAFTGLLISSAVADWNILRPWKSSLVQEGLKNYCESWRINVELNNIKGFDVVPQECVEFVGKYMTSSQYKADIERAIEESVLYLSKGCCSLKGDDKDAWIFDIDDTLVSIVPYYKKHHFG